MIEYGFGEIGSGQLAFDKFHPVESASGQIDIGQVAILEYDIAELGFPEIAAHKVTIREQAAVDGKVGPLPVFDTLPFERGLHQLFFPIGKSIHQVGYLG